MVFGEIGARSPGGKLVDQMNFANDFDLYREWARTVCLRSFDARPHRRYHVAALFKRAEGQGQGFVLWLGPNLRHGRRQAKARQTNND